MYSKTTYNIQKPGRMVQLLIQTKIYLKACNFEYLFGKGCNSYDDKQFAIS